MDQSVLSDEPSCSSSAVFTEIHSEQAARMEPHSLGRILNVAAFSLSAYSGVRRTCKPFNSLMGETYELACPTKGFRFLAEKVLSGKLILRGHDVLSKMSFNGDLIFTG